MFNSIFYHGSVNDNLKTFHPQAMQFIKIFAFKIIIILILLIFMSILNQETIAVIIAILVSMQFYLTRHFAKSMVQISWYIDTSQKQDQIIYQANLAVPPSKYQLTFWYSFLIYLIILTLFSFIVINQSKLSLFCAILIGIVLTFVNFYIFSKIINLRNDGVLQKISDQVVPQASMIKMPLVHQSKLDRKCKIGLKSSIRIINNEDYDRTSMIRSNYKGNKQNINNKGNNNKNNENKSQVRNYNVIVQQD